MVRGSPVRGNGGKMLEHEKHSSHFNARVTLWKPRFLAGFLLDKIT